jgi:hypothetical protein
MTAPYDEGPDWGKIYLQSTWAARTVEFMVGPEAVEAMSSIGFAARRRKEQDQVIAELLPIVTRWINDIDNPNRFVEINEALTQVYLDTYLAEGGDRRARTAGFIYSLRGVVNHTMSTSDPETTATWLAVAAMNAATLQAGVDEVPGPVTADGSPWTRCATATCRFR